MTTWDTPTHASAITGTTVAQVDLDRATEMIELWTGVIADTPPTRPDGTAAIKPLDLRLLKQAEAWQAAWLIRQTDLAGRSDVDQIRQDDMQYNKGNEDAHVLSPLARRAIKQLSWKRGRTLEPLTPQQALVLRGKRTPEMIGVQPVSAESYAEDPEDSYRWRPM